VLFPLILGELFDICGISLFGKINDKKSHWTRDDLNICL